MGRVGRTLIYLTGFKPQLIQLHPDCQVHTSVSYEPNFSGQGVGAGYLQLFRVFSGKIMVFYFLLPSHFLPWNQLSLILCLLWGSWSQRWGQGDAGGGQFSESGLKCVDNSTWLFLSLFLPLTWVIFDAFIFWSGSGRIANPATPKPYVCRLDQGLDTVGNSVPCVFVPNVPGHSRI